MCGTCCRRIQVRPFPRPLGNDGALPLLAAVADGFHAVDSHRGTIFRDNFIVNTGQALMSCWRQGTEKSLHDLKLILLCTQLEELRPACCTQAYSVMLAYIFGRKGTP